MNEIKIGDKVRAATMRAKEDFSGEVVKIEQKIRGAWYSIKRDIDGEIRKVRAAKIKVA